MLGKLLGKTIKLTLGGTASLLGYNYLQTNSQQKLTVLPVAQLPTMFPTPQQHVKVIATSPWSELEPYLPELLFGARTPDRRFLYIANSRLPEAEDRTLDLLKDPSYDKWATEKNSDRNLLYFATKNGWSKVVAILLREKPRMVNHRYRDFNSHDYETTITLLELALEHERSSTARVLIDCGATVDTATSVDCKSLRSYFCTRPIPAISVAVQLGDLELVEKMVKLCPELLRCQDKDGATPLFYTVTGSDHKVNLDMIGLLIRLGASPHDQDYEGQTFILRLEQIGDKALAAELCKNSGHKCHLSHAG